MPAATTPQQPDGRVEGARVKPLEAADQTGIAQQQPQNGEQASTGGDISAAPAVTAAHDRELESEEVDEDSKKGKKRKVAVFMAYLGHGYLGMQRNPGALTIEGELLVALAKAGCIPTELQDSPGQLHWMRAARTDKGVSAIGQVVSLQMNLDPQESVVQRIQQHLPDQIRVLGVQRVTKGFDARKMCDRRRYEYILPAWVFDPNACRERYFFHRCRNGGPSEEFLDDLPDAEGPAAGSAAPATGGTTSEAAAAENGGVAGAEKGQAAGAADAEGGAAAAERAAVGDDAPRSAAATAAAAAGGEAGSGVAGAAAGAGPGAGGTAQQQAGEEQVQQAAEGGDGAKQLQGADGQSGEGGGVAADDEGGGDGGTDFVFTPEHKKRLDAILSGYCGTRSFHNFTVGVPAGTPQAKRYIKSYTCEPFEIEGEQWVRLVVIGQSFMLHQIRKMVGLAVAIMRGVAPPKCLAAALHPSKDINTPLAPELGLFLVETYYDAYNRKWGELHGNVAMAPYQDAIDAFKMSPLYPHIAARDKAERVNYMWLRTLNERNYEFTTWDHTKSNKAEGSGGSNTLRKNYGTPRNPGKRGFNAGQGGADASTKRQKISAVALAPEEWSD